MLTPTRDGVICDFCGTVYKDAFTYYSIQSTLISVKQGLKTQTNGPLNKDMCTGCFVNLTDKVKANLGPHKKGFVKCDLSKTYHNNNFEYVVLNLDKVDVDRNRANKMVVDKQLLDLNIIKYHDLVNQIKAVSQKVANQGSWS